MNSDAPEAALRHEKRKESTIPPSSPLSDDVHTTPVAPLLETSGGALCLNTRVSAESYERQAGGTAGGGGGRKERNRGKTGRVSAEPLTHCGASARPSPKQQPSLPFRSLVAAAVRAAGCSSQLPRVRALKNLPASLTGLSTLLAQRQGESSSLWPGGQPSGKKVEKISDKTRGFSAALGRPSSSDPQ